MYDPSTKMSISDPLAVRLSHVIQGRTYYFYRLPGANGVPEFIFPDTTVEFDRRNMMVEYLFAYHSVSANFLVPALHNEHPFMHEARVRTLRYQMALHEHLRLIRNRQSLVFSFQTLVILGHADGI